MGIRNAGYRAVDAPKAFAIHQYPVERRCTVSCNIKSALSRVLDETQKALEQRLSRISLAQVISDLHLGIQGDVSKLADLDRLYATIRKQKGHLDIVFANAGGGSFAPLGAITEEHFDQVFNINVKGLLFTVQKALPLLKDGGAIILNASIVASIGMEAFSVYSATKAAVRSFARTWTTDLKARKIRVNVISPGVVPTEGYRSLGDEKQIGQFAAQMATHQAPLRASSP